uniref:Uncharacterized protein n=1 Tax=Anguilla anguilla TaxID=7936 RepID=A0A0E9VX83_ANGAN
MWNHWSVRQNFEKRLHLLHCGGKRSYFSECVCLQRVRLLSVCRCE